MTNYSTEFKLKVVTYCIENHYGSKRAAKHFKIPAKSCVQDWVRRYKKHGIDGLIRKKNVAYTGEFKINVVEYMRNNHLSYLETAIHFNIPNSDKILKWERIYCEKGPLAFFEDQRGQHESMEKKETKKLTDMSEKELIKEIEYLRMENAYLKKLRALVQQRNQPKKKK
jgi:transposase